MASFPNDTPPHTLLDGPDGTRVPSRLSTSPPPPSDPAILKKRRELAVRTYSQATDRLLSAIASKAVDRVRVSRSKLVEYFDEMENRQAA